MSFSEATLGEISIEGKGSYGIAASAVNYSRDLYTYLRITDINDDGTLNKEGLKSVDDKNATKYILKPNDIVFARTGASTGRSYFYDGCDGEFVYAGFLIKFSLDTQKVNPKFIRYYTLSDEYNSWVNSFKTGSTRGNINAQTYANMKINLPDRNQQNLLVQTLSCLDAKIEINNRINNTLEEMVQAIFKSWFVDFEPFQDGEFEDSELGMIPKGWGVGALGNYVKSIDNRGKTPPLAECVTGYPIIDVRALSGETRVINYNNCTKYVDENTYNNWFRSGHPQPYDILISTVGSLAEMKLFYGNRGCVAQNVVGFRCINISPLYLYQYLQYIKSDLISYNIGSVQPSIKVTHIIKHKILIPEDTVLENFHKLVDALSRQIFKNSEATVKLIEIRDAILPKLMSGEIRVPIEEVQ